MQTSDVQTSAQCRNKLDKKQARLPPHRRYTDILDKITRPTYSTAPEAGRMIQSQVKRDTVINDGLCNTSKRGEAYTDVKNVKQK